MRDAFASQDELLCEVEMNNDAELSLVLYVIAGELDMPSVYMGGPSPTSKRRARRIIDALRMNGVTFVIEPDDE